MGMSLVVASVYKAAGSPTPDLPGPLPSLDLSGIDWVIVGGESGQEAGIPFFMKQLGSMWQGAQPGARFGKGGDLAHFPADLRCRHITPCHPPLGK